MDRGIVCPRLAGLGVVRSCVSSCAWGCTYRDRQGDCRSDRFRFCKDWVSNEFSRQSSLRMRRCALRFPPRSARTACPPSPRTRTPALCIFASPRVFQILQAPGRARRLEAKEPTHLMMTAGCLLAACRVRYGNGRRKMRLGRTHQKVLGGLLPIRCSGTPTIHLCRLIGRIDWPGASRVSFSMVRAPKLYLGQTPARGIARESDDAICDIRCLSIFRRLCHRRQHPANIVEPRTTDPRPPGRPRVAFRNESQHGVYACYWRWCCRGGLPGTQLLVTP